MNRFVLYAITLILLFSGATSYCQYPYPSMAHNGVESELLSRAGNKLVIYDAYSKELYSSDSTNLTLIHDFMFSNNQPSLRDYETTTDYLYFSGIVSPPGSYEYYNVYKTDGITLDTVFNFKSSFNTSIYPPWKNLATYNDTLYFWQRDTLMSADPTGAVTNLGKLYGTGWLDTWNDKIAVFENDVSHHDLKIFDTQTQTFTATINVVDPQNISVYHYPVYNNYLLYCDSSLKYVDPVTLSVQLIDSSLYYRGIIGILNNKIYCLAADHQGVYGTEIYAVDITTHVVTLVKDINPGTASSYGNEIETFSVQATHLIYFYADDSVHGLELWVTDGTTPGTHLVLDYAPGTNDTYPHSLYSSQKPDFRVSDLAYVVGDTLITCAYPYNTPPIAHFVVTNGTQYYTIDLVSNNSGQEFAKYFTEFNGNVYFSAEITPAPWGHLFRFNSSQITGLFNEDLQSDISIFPNPAHKEFSIDFEKVHAPYSIKIYTTMGVLVYAVDVKTTAANPDQSKQITLNAPSGIYFVKVSDGEKVWTGKVLVE